MNYIVFDLEATCWPQEDINDKLKHNYKFNEIIEIGAVKLNDKLEIIDKFDVFIKPTLNPILSDFCKELTHITQQNVDNGLSFNKGITDFANWCILDQNNKETNCYLCSWGYYDKKQILKEIDKKYYKGKIKNLLNNHISIKHQFGEIYNIRPCGVQKALNILKLNFQGTQHRAIDDALNITEIFKVIFKNLSFN